jgi:hypothetical protein
MTALSGWENFYVIVGSSAGALIGLQFVVITLIADMPQRDGSYQAGQAFGTPTIVHFGAVLLLAAIIAAPWHSLAPAAALWGLLGAAGVLYLALTVRRMRGQSAYRPELEDWIFHAFLPLAGYATLAAASLASSTHAHHSLFAVAAAVLLLLFVGIHNAWDAVTYHVYVSRPRQNKR